jgi:hypothetical protein
VKNLFVLSLGLILTFLVAASAAFAQNATLSDQIRPTAQGLTMVPDPQDPPATARFKAALRLMAGFNYVLALTQACQRRDVWENYQNRNGRTFGRVYGAVKSGGAFDDKYRALVEVWAKTLTQAALKAGCDEAIHDIDEGGWDLYKAVRFKEDYQFFLQK